MAWLSAVSAGQTILASHVNSLRDNVPRKATSYEGQNFYTAGSLLFADGSGFVEQDNANLFWDNTNNCLRLGSTGSFAQSKLYVSGSISISGSDTDFSLGGNRGFLDTAGSPLHMRLGMAAGGGAAIGGIRFNGGGIGEMARFTDNGAFVWMTRTANNDSDMANGQMHFYLQSNTSLRIRVKGSDGTVREATLTLA